jgi:hypothetical protein
MKTKLFINVAILLATSSLAEVKVNEYTMPPSEAIPYSPVVCGDWAIAELKMIYGWGETLGVVAFDLKAGKQTKIFTGKAWGLAMTGSLAMWCQTDGKNEDSSILAGCDLATGKQWKPKHPEGVSDPVAFGDHVVYECDDLIYLYNIKTDARTCISDQRHLHRYPNIGGDLVVWLEFEDTAFERSRVIGYRISTGQRYQFSDIFDDSNSRPETDGDYVVWHSNNIAGILYNVKTGKIRYVKYALYPDVSDGIVVYEKSTVAKDESHHAGKRIVCGVDLRANGEEFRISKNVGINQVFIHGNRVVWNESKVLHVADLTRM